MAWASGKEQLNVRRINSANIQSHAETMKYPRLTALNGGEAKKIGSCEIRDACEGKFDSPYVESYV